METLDPRCGASLQPGVLFDRINVGDHYGLGAKLIYMGYFASLLHPPGRKTWLLFSVRDMSWGLRNPCFTKFSVVSFL